MTTPGSEPGFPGRRVRSLSDRGAVALAVAAAAGALAAHPVHPVAVVAALAVSVAIRRPGLLLVGVAALTSTLAVRSVAGLDAALDPAVSGVATIVADGERVGAAVRIDAAIGGRRYELWGRGRIGDRLARAAAGERWQLTARVRPVDSEDRWRRSRHIAGTGSVAAAERIDGGARPFRIANTVRELISRSGRSLSRRDRALLGGLTIGDDRGQRPEVVHDFRRSGLSHLLAVSGQNVAFVLVMIGPLVRRLGPGARLVTLAAVLGEFALVTRWEPSVLRACVLAGLAAASQITARPVSGLRLLSLAVTLLLVVDPLLVHSVGFQLSVAASAGIAVLARPLETVIGGPGWLVRPLSVTAAAQIGVLPVQVTVFGDLPVVSLPANLLAGPAAGPAMVWGLGAGLAGGLLGEPWAARLHLPTRLLVGWIAGVARVAAAIDAPSLDGTAIAAAAITVVALAVWRLRSRVVLAAALGVGCATAALSPPAPLPTGADLWAVGEPVLVVVVDRPSPTWALDTLTRSGIDRIDVLVSRSRSSQAADAVRAIASRHDVTRVLAPRGFPAVVPHTTVVAETVVGAVRLRPDGTRLHVEPAAGATVGRG